MSPVNTGGMNVMQVRRNSFELVATLMCSAAFWLPASAVAQTGTQPTAGPEESTPDEGTKSDNVIVVTALRGGATELSRTPIAISAISGEQLESNAVTEIGEALANEPGVSVVSFSGGNATVQIRGVSSLDGDSTVGYYLDEFPFASGVSLPDANPFDLERIEVLRGPQGTLYGFGSIGGTVRVLTANPDLSEFQFKGSTSYTNQLGEGDDGYSVNAAINLPIISDGLAARVVYSRRELGGYLDAIGTGEDNVNGVKIDTFRAKILAKPTQNFSLLATVWLNRLEAGGQDFGSASLIALTEEEDLSNQYDLYNLVGELELDGVSIISSTSYLEGNRGLDAIFPLVGGNALLGDETSQQNFTQEFRFTTNGESSLKFTGGAIYSDIQTDSLGLLDFAGFVQDDTTMETSESWAVFGEATLKLLDDRLQLTGGLRYFEDRRSITEVSDQVFLGTPLGVIDYGTTREKFSAWTPKFNVAYFASDDWLIYANVAKGFRSGRLVGGSIVARAALEGVVVDPRVDPDTVWSYEIGFKGESADGRVAVTGAVYYLDWSDVQITVPIALGSVGVPSNGANAEALGFEGSISYEPLDGLRFDLSGNINNAQFTQAVPTLSIVSGDQLDNSVREQFVGQIEYKWDIGKLLTQGTEGLISASIQHNSPREIRGFGIEDVADPITLASARVGVKNEHWGLYLIGSNLLDERGAAGGGGGGFFLRVPPRSITISATFAY